MSFSQHLVLWVHVAFVVFTIGPVTLAIMSTPRYIRRHDVRILRYLTRMTFVLAVASLGVLIAGLALASMISKAGQPWVIVSATLFVVAILLLGLIHRDQRHAIRALEAARSGAPDRHVRSHASGDKDDKAAAAAAAPAPAAQPPTDAHGPASAKTAEDAPDAADGETSAEAASAHAGGEDAIAAHVASVERGRIAMMGGVVSLIWLVILVLMVWNG